MNNSGTPASDQLTPELLTIAVDADATGAINFAELWEQARTLGCNNVALRFDPAGTSTRCNAALTEPKKIIRELDGLQVVAISTAGGPDLRPAIECAVAIGCPLVRVVDPSDDDELGATADVGIAIDFTAVRDRVRRLWHRVDSIHRPAVRACWTADADPASAVPTLASVLSLVRIDSVLHPATVRTTIDRLRGIGFAGPVILTGDVTAERIAMIRKLLL